MTREHGVDPRLVHAWLAARSVARGLPAPVLDRGGLRVDANTPDERRRWVFPIMEPRLVELGRQINEPGHLLKLCGDAEALQAVLPARWRLHAPGFFMQGGATHAQGSSLAGYDIQVRRRGPVAEVRILSATGELAASGGGAKTADAFVYDRIVTSPHHRRRGLASAVMAALQQSRRDPGKPQLLVATADGQALYTALGWRTVSPYATASIPDAEDQPTDDPAQPASG